MKIPFPAFGHDDGLYGVTYALAQTARKPPLKSRVSWKNGSRCRSRIIISRSIKLPSD